MGHWWLSSYIYFNPLPRKEGDQSSNGKLCAGGNFNPLPRKEGDGCDFLSVMPPNNFNPLPRKEGDSCTS